jgi:diaminopimelate epimerase
LSKSRWPLPFMKYSGAGNDFIILDARDGDPVGDPGSLAKSLCRRGRSVGADGLIVVEPPDADDGELLARMRLWNADGSEAEISGNGARCVARFLVDHGADPTAVRFATDVGTVSAQVDGDLCRLQLPTRAQVFPNRRLRVEGRDLTGTYVEVGVPFFVCFHDNPDDLAVRFIGRAIRNHAELAPRGANVDFVRIEDEQRLYFRVYERGVEDETLSSGTGSIAAALASAASGKVASPVICVARGAELTVRFRRAEAPSAAGAAPAEQGVAANRASSTSETSPSGDIAQGPRETARPHEPDGEGVATAEAAAEHAGEEEPSAAAALPPLVEAVPPADRLLFVDLEIEGDAMPIYSGEATVQASRGPRRG